jgi:hypothetical protein
LKSRCQGDIEEDVAIHRTRKNKENPHYGFLVSWQPKDHFQARVKGESNLGKIVDSATSRHEEKAVSLAQGALALGTKKNIIRSLILIGFILILELVVYLAWNKFVLS